MLRITWPGPFYLLIKNNKITKKTNVFKLLSFPHRYPANADGFFPFVTQKCTKIHLRLSNTPSSPNLLSKNTKISFNHTRWIQIILSFPPQGITGNMAKTASWKSKIPSAELHNYLDVGKQGNAVDRNLSWEGKWAETNWIFWNIFLQTKKCFTRNLRSKLTIRCTRRDVSMHNTGLWSTLFPRSTNGKITYVIILKPKL